MILYSYVKIPLQPILQQICVYIRETQSQKF